MPSQLFSRHRFAVRRAHSYAEAVVFHKNYFQERYVRGQKLLKEQLGDSPSYKAESTRTFPTYITYELDHEDALLYHEVFTGKLNYIITNTFVKQMETLSRIHAVQQKARQKVISQRLSTIDIKRHSPDFSVCDKSTTLYDYIRKFNKAEERYQQAMLALMDKYEAWARAGVHYED